jgi:hypothetical protein
MFILIDKTAVVICRSMGFWNWSQEVMRPKYFGSSTLKTMSSWLPSNFTLSLKRF